MKRENILIWEQYQKSWRNEQSDLFDDAIRNPQNYYIHISYVPGMDYESGYIETPEIIIYSIGENGKYDKFEIVSNPDDISIIIDIFERQAPQNIKDDK
jgi:hypothetical protein